MRLAVVLLVLAGGAWARERVPENSIYVYELFKGAPSCAALEQRLKALPLRSTVIASIEEGAEFVPDRKDGEQQLACVAQQLRRQRRSLKLLLLQDPVFLEKTGEALRRAAFIQSFARRHPGWIRAVQIDVEPYASEAWKCADVARRRELLRGLHDLLAQVRRQLRPVPIGIAAAWWYGSAKELDEASPQKLAEVTDEIYLMAYGDPGGPLVGGSAERVLARIDEPEFFPARSRVYVALASYEYRSRSHLEQERQAITRRLSGRRGFAGTAVFHAQAAFDVPVGRFVSGQVTDAEGNFLADATIEAAGSTARTNACGEFMLRINGEASEVTVHREGYAKRSVATELLPAGDVRVLGVIVLEKAPATVPNGSRT